VCDERAKLVDERRRLAGCDDLQVARERDEERLGVDHVRQDDHQQDHQRHDRQQRVVGDAAGEKQPLVRAERAHRLLQEAEGIVRDLACGT
jgi:hypothetical protein